jgi:hypothetical protein
VGVAASWLDPRPRWDHHDGGDGVRRLSAMRLMTPVYDLDGSVLFPAPAGLSTPSTPRRRLSGRGSRRDGGPMASRRDDHGVVGNVAPSASGRRRAPARQECRARLTGPWPPPHPVPAYYLKAECLCRRKKGHLGQHRCWCGVRWEGPGDGAGGPAGSTRHWLVACACGWAVEVPSREAAEEMVDRHPEGSSEPGFHSIEISAGKEI